MLSWYVEAEAQFIDLRVPNKVSKMVANEIAI